MFISKMDVIHKRIEKLTKPGYKIRFNINDTSFSFEIVIKNIKTEKFVYQKLDGFELEQIGLDNIINRMYVEFDEED